MTPRKPVLMTTVEIVAPGTLTGKTSLHAVACNDGSVWEIVGHDEWIELPPIPGSARDLEQQRKRR